jgi:hypothetical protein
MKNDKVFIYGLMILVFAMHSIFWVLCILNLCKITMSFDFCFDWNFFVAIGTFLAVLVALKEEVKKFFFKPKLEIEVVDGGNIASVNEEKIDAIFYHLKVINRGDYLAKNCQVVLLECKKEHTEERIFANDMPPFPWSPKWAYSKKMKGIDIYKHGYHTFDFGYITSDRFIPMNFWEPKDAIRHPERFTLEHEKVCYTLQLSGENFPPQKFVFQVELNGKFTNDLEAMKENLKITNATKSALKGEIQ